MAGNILGDFIAEVPDSTDGDCHLRRRRWQPGTHLAMMRALINSVPRRDLVHSRRRRRNTPGNAQAEGLSTLISSGERPRRPTEGESDSQESLISQVAKDRGAADIFVCRPLFFAAITEMS
jgi:hypothetical protein